MNKIKIGEDIYNVVPILSDILSDRDKVININLTIGQIKDYIKLCSHQNYDEKFLNYISSHYAEELDAYFFNICEIQKKVDPEMEKINIVNVLNPFLQYTYIDDPELQHWIIKSIYRLLGNKLLYNKENICEIKEKEIYEEVYIPYWFQYFNKDYINNKIQLKNLFYLCFLGLNLYQDQEVNNEIIIPQYRETLKIELVYKIYANLCSIFFIDVVCFDDITKSDIVYDVGKKLDDLIKENNISFESLTLNDVYYLMGQVEKFSEKLCNNKNTKCFLINLLLKRIFQKTKKYIKYYSINIVEEFSKNRNKNNGVDYFLNYWVKCQNKKTTLLWVNDKINNKYNKEIKEIKKILKKTSLYS